MGVTLIIVKFRNASVMWNSKAFHNKSWILSWYLRVLYHFLFYFLLTVAERWWWQWWWRRRWCCYQVLKNTIPWNVSPTCFPSSLPVYGWMAGWLMDEEMHSLAFAFFIFYINGIQLLSLMIVKIKRYTLLLTKIVRKSSGACGTCLDTSLLKK